MHRSFSDATGFDVRRSRRQLLRTVAVGAVGVGSAALLAACGSSGTTTATSSSAPAGSAAVTGSGTTTAISSSAPAGSAAVTGSTAATSVAANTSVAPTPTLPAPRAVGKGTEIRWQFRGSPDDLKGAENELNKSFVPKYANIKVTIEPAPDRRDEKLIAEMVGGTAPDVFETWGDNVQQFAEKGQVLDINPLVLRDKVDVSDFYQWQWHDFDIPIKGGQSLGGSQIRFGVPKYVNVMMVWVNKDMFQQKGVALPTLDWTHDDYANAMEKLTVMDGAKVKTGGGFIPMDNWDRFWYRLVMWGGNDADPNDPTKSDLGDKPAQDAFEWARHLEFDLKHLIVTTAGMPQTQGDRFFAAQWAMQEEGVYPFQMAKNNAASKIAWQYAHVPKGPVTRKVLGTTDSFSGTKQTKHAAETWTLLQYLAGPEYQTAQVGISGLLPVRTSVLAKWKDICIQKYPELANVNLEACSDAMKMGYPGNRSFYKNTTSAQELITPALQKVFDVGNTPVTYFQQVAQQVSQVQKSG